MKTNTTITILLSAVSVLSLGPFAGCSSQEHHAETTSPSSPPAPVSDSNSSKPESAKVSEMFILGLRRPDRSLQTIAVDSRGFHEVGEGVQVPTQIGVRIVDRLVRSEPRFHLEKISSWRKGDQRPAAPAPAYEDPSLSQAQRESGKLEWEQNQLAKLVFVGPKFVSVVHENGGFTGGAHGYARTDLATYPIENVSFDKREPIGQVLGAIAEKKLFSKGKQALKDGLAEPDPTLWGLVRRNGNWVIRGCLTYNVEVNRGQYALFPVGAKIPPSLTRTPGPAVTWKSLAKRYEDPRDIINGSSRRLEIVSMKSHTILLVDHKKAAVRAANKPAIVMALFSDNPAEIKNWRKQLDLPR